MSLAHLVDYGDRRLGEDAHRRIDNVEARRPLVIEHLGRLVLPGHQYVTDPVLYPKVSVESAHWRRAPTHSYRVC